MAAAKRKCETVVQGEESGDDEENQVVTPKRRRVEFQDVTVYNFKRRQGYVCVPSQGGNTLGMEDDHYGVEVFTIDEHASERRKESREAMLRGDSEGPSTSIMSEPTSHGDQEDEEDYTSILIPVDSKERRVVLRRAGVTEIDVKEKEECRELRTSRQACGCTCQLYCLPDSCGCAKEGIKCQVDRPGFPCSCTAEGCLNKTGRLEFNPVKVRTHFVRTIMRTRLEEARYLPHTPNNYLPSGLGYLAQMYTQQEGQQQAIYGSDGQWIGSWGMDNPWWAFTAQHNAVNEEVGVSCEESQEESIVDTESSDSEEEIFTELVEEETCISEVVTEETKVISKSEEDTLEIINEVLNKVNEQSSTSNVTTDDEGISSDNSYYEDTRLQADNESGNGKSEEDLSERSEGFDEEISEDNCQQYCQIEFNTADTATETNKSRKNNFENITSSFGFDPEDSNCSNGSDTEESVDAPSSGLFQEYSSLKYVSQPVSFVETESTKPGNATGGEIRACPDITPEANNVPSPLVETIPA